MSTVQPNYLFLNNPAAADVTLANRILTLGQNANSIAMNVQKVDSLRKVEGVAAVARVQTVTITAPAAVGTDYAFQVIQQSGSEYRPVYVSYESVAGDTAITVATALAAVANAQITSGNLGLASAANGGTAVVTLTATTSNPIFLTEVLEAGSGMVIATSTAGNEAFGQGTDLLADGVIGISEQPVAGTSYDALFIQYGDPVEEGNTIKRDQAASLVVYYNEAGASLAAFLTALNAAITAATANAELINLSDAIS
jgi:hypothetical protein